MIKEQVNTLIPLSIPHINGKEWEYVKDCLDTGWVSSVGAYVSQFEQVVAEYAGARYGIACMNGTAGLHMAMHLHGIGQGDYVIAPNITFIATLNAIKYTGADPILMDINPHNWQMDLDLLAHFLEEQTDLIKGQRVLKSDQRPIKAIMPVHVLGNMGNMTQLLELAKRYDLIILEDSTEALGSYFNGQHAGSFGAMGVFSFNGNKIISTGGGGVMVTDDEALAKRAKHLTTQAKVSSMEYIHDEIGYNYRLVNVLAAIGVAQMEQLPDFIQKKKRMDHYYRSQLNGVGDIRFQQVDEQVDPNCWLCTIHTKEMRGLLHYLNEHKVQSRPFWMPMNQLPMFSEVLYVREKDHAADVYQNALSIPSSVGLSEAQLYRVVETIKDYFQKTA